MFWGLILKANKRYTQVLEKSFHLSQATLDHSSSDDEPIQVMYSHEDSSYLLCTLQKGSQIQCPLDLNFAQGEKLCFLTKGNGIVHLTGFLIPDDEFGDFDSGDEEEEEEDEVEIPDLREKLNKKGVKEQKNNKKKQPVVEEEESDDDDEDEMDVTKDEEADSEEEDEADSDEEVEDGSEGEDDEDEEEESDEEEVVPPKKMPKLDKQQVASKDKKQQNGVANGQEKKKDKKGKEVQQSAQQQNQKDSKPGQMQKLQGGLVFQDLKTGNGAEAKAGKKIQVYYEGRLKANNKVFDATKTGPGFKMTIGRGEVIKAWDLGLVGMKVGGKRRLICPPQLAYGPRGNPPVIPANSTLVFDIELKNVL